MRNKARDTLFGGILLFGLLFAGSLGAETGTRLSSESVVAGETIGIRGVIEPGQPLNIVISAKKVLP